MSIRGSKRAAAMGAALSVSFAEQQPTGMRTHPICEWCGVVVPADRNAWPIRYEYVKPKRAHRTPLCIPCAKQLLSLAGSMRAVVERFCTLSLKTLVRSATDEAVTACEPHPDRETEAQSEDELRP